ncbi:unnamed protein product, partial [Symbiodinium necroappetens]
VDVWHLSSQPAGDRDPHCERQARLARCQGWWTSAEPHAATLCQQLGARHKRSLRSRYRSGLCVSSRRRAGNPQGNFERLALVRHGAAALCGRSRDLRVSLRLRPRCLLVSPPTWRIGCRQAALPL